MILERGRLAWVINELVARVNSDIVIPIPIPMAKALPAIYRITARYKPMRENTLRLNIVLIVMVKGSHLRLEMLIHRIVMPEQIVN